VCAFYVFELLELYERNSNVRTFVCLGLDSANAFVAQACVGTKIQ
jgi:hypothetical protein